MARIVIEFADQSRRGYELPERFTFRESREFKRITGMNLSQSWSALSDGDVDVIVAFATIAARRAGHDIEDAILDLPLDAISVEGDVDPTPADADASAPAAPKKTPAATGTPASSASTD